MALSLYEKFQSCEDNQQSAKSVRIENLFIILKIISFFVF
jgi:hypothetical protein